MKTLMYVGLVLLVGLSSCRDDDAAQPMVDTIGVEVQSLIQPLIDDGVSVGASVGTFHGGKKAEYFFGTKEVNGEPIDENTLFEIGSITKTMTGTLLAKLVKERKVSLDDPVEMYLPEGISMPDHAGEQITLQHLANHTSSLPNIPDNFLSPDFDENDPFAHYSDALLLEFVNNHSLNRPIGEAVEYSNLAFCLLGYVLGQIEGKPVKQLYEDYIFSELGMMQTHTSIPTNSLDLAQPHDGDLQAVSPWSFTQATFGAAGVVSTLSDMLLYMEANMGKKETSLSSAMELAQRNTQDLDDPVGVGLAWVNYPHQTENETLTWHDGGTRGTVAFLGFIKELDLGVVVFFNTEIDERLGQELLALQIGTQVLSILKQY